MNRTLAESGSCFEVRAHNTASSVVEHRAGDGIGPELVGIDTEQCGEPCTRTIDAALDGADRAIADARGFFVAEARGADEYQRFALCLRELVERNGEFAELNVALLLGLRLQSFGVRAVGVFHFAPALAIFAPEQVAKYRKEPGAHVRPDLERVPVGERAQERFLHEVVGPVHVAAQ